MQVEVGKGKFVEIPPEEYYSVDFDIRDWMDAPTEDVDFKKNRELRIKEYHEVSDPLFFEWQYDKTREKEMAWRAAVMNIKTKYPIK